MVEEKKKRSRTTTKEKRFYCERYKELRTLIAGRKVKFINHEFFTSDPILIAGLEKLDSVEPFNDAMKRKAVRLDSKTMEKLRAEVKAELKKEMREAVRKELDEEMREPEEVPEIKKEKKPEEVKNKGAL